ncbi:MAG: hypothetical protein Q7S53_05395 [bacterium]|nr:hypothetical protein [bacterium]
MEDLWFVIPDFLPDLNGRSGGDPESRIIKPAKVVIIIIHFFRKSGAKIAA